MLKEIHQMVDMVFDLSGDNPPDSYPFELWSEITRRVPDLEAQRYAGVLPLRLPTGNAGLGLHKRAKLTLRLPDVLSGAAATRLTGEQLVVEGTRLQLGRAKRRDIQPYPTVHAQIVAGPSDEMHFMEGIRREMEDLGIAGGLICGRRHLLASGARSITGFSLVVHDLKDDASLALQYAGLGDARRFGCGIFVPYKLISGLND